MELSAIFLHPLAYAAKFKKVEIRFIINIPTTVQIVTNLSIETTKAEKFIFDELTG